MKLELVSRITVTYICYSNLTRTMSVFWVKMKKMGVGLSQVAVGIFLSKAKYILGDIFFSLSFLPFVHSTFCPFYPLSMYLDLSNRGQVKKQRLASR